MVLCIFLGSVLGSGDHPPNPPVQQILVGPGGQFLQSLPGQPQQSHLIHVVPQGGVLPTPPLPPPGGQYGMWPPVSGAAVVEPAIDPRKGMNCFKPSNKELHSYMTLCLCVYVFRSDSHSWSCCSATGCPPTWHVPRTQWPPDPTWYNTTPDPCGGHGTNDAPWRGKGRVSSPWLCWSPTTSPWSPGVQTTAPWTRRKLLLRKCTMLLLLHCYVFDNSLFGTN